MDGMVVTLEKALHVHHEAECKKNNISKIYEATLASAGEEKPEIKVVNWALLKAAGTPIDWTALLVSSAAPLFTQIAADDCC